MNCNRYVGLEICAVGSMLYDFFCRESLLALKMKINRFYKPFAAQIFVDL